MRVSVAAIAAFCAMSLSAEAQAAPVDNPGNWVWSTGGGTLYLNESSPVSFPISTSPGGSMDTDIDGLGDIIYNSYTLPDIPIYTGYAVRLQVQPGTSSGNIDASTSSGNASGTLRIRVKVMSTTVPAMLGNNCMTAYFNLPWVGDYSYNVPNTSGQLAMDSYTGTTQWIQVPALTNCNGYESGLNSSFGFGSGSGGIKLIRLGATVSPLAPYGS